ncbi:DUF6091 family protein [Limnobacter humi]|uniref:DUF6091 family protein n=1 Tax=Limnobacter humi TaxID=1778671 RepID=A0ABT1WFP2_9BURK|nr:putative solute-binding protein [Limnobacter humi]MCQ8896189.1 DUF6091 family protein [Limnobacter humi]
MKFKPAQGLAASVLATLGLTLGVAAPAQAAANSKLCVYDLLGATGDVYNMSKDYVVAAKQWGADIELRAYTDERIATQDFIAGECDALYATGFRTRQFNATTAVLDSLGVSSIVKNNKVDMPASYDVVRRAIQLFAQPAAAKLNVNGKYEIAGIIPFGTAYPVINDRKIRTVEDLAGKKIAAFDYDKAQAVMIQKIGAQPVSADITNFASKFNNGAVDMIAAPAAAYKPLELYRGIGTKGAINRFPIVILSYQMVINNTKFPSGFGAKSRTYWLSQFDRALSIITRAEKSIPEGTWSDLTPENMIKYTVMLRESRVSIADQGLYDKGGLKILKKIRCGVNPADSECSTNSENWN